MAFSFLTTALKKWWIGYTILEIDKKKICGILNETLFYNDLKFLVIGIGINIVSSPNIRDYPTTNLNEVTNRRVNKTKLLNKIIKAFNVKIKWLL